MALDPQIALGGAPAPQPEPDQPISTSFSNIATATDTAAQARQRIIDLQTQGQINAAVAQTGGDYDKAIPILAQQGAGLAGMKLQTALADYRKQVAANQKASIDNHIAMAGLLGSIGQTMVTNPTAAQAQVTHDAMMELAQQDPELQGLVHGGFTGDLTDPDNVAKIGRSFSTIAQSGKDFADNARAYADMYEKGDYQEHLFSILAASDDPAGLLQHMAADTMAYPKSVVDRATSVLAQAKNIPDADARATFIRQAGETGAQVQTGTAAMIRAQATLTRAEAATHEFKDVPVVMNGKTTQLSMDVKSGTFYKQNADGSMTPVSAAERQQIPTASAATGAPMTDAALDQAAQKYLDTGMLPNLGMGGASARIAIMNRAGVIGGGQRLAANSAEYNANRATYTTLTRQLTNLRAFENTANANLGQFMTLAQQLPDSGVPWINTPVRSIDENAVGQQYLPAIRAAKQVALTEISRIVSNPNLTGQLSDAAREEVTQLIPDKATLPQIQHVVQVLQTDMKNRRVAMGEQASDIASRLGITGGGIGNEPPPAQAPADKRPPATGSKPPTDKTLGWVSPAGLSHYREGHWVSDAYWAQTHPGGE